MSNDNEQAAKPKGKMKKIMLGLVGFCTLVGAGAGAGFYFANAAAPLHEAENAHWPKLVTREDAPEHVAGGEGEEAAPARVGTVSVKSDKVKADPTKYAIRYIPIDDTFTSNLAGGAGFIQVNISLATYYDDQVVQNVARQMVPLRSSILMVLSEQSAEAATSTSGKHAMQRELTDAINGVLREKEGFGGIDNVYFSNFVVQ